MTETNRVQRWRAGRPSENDAATSGKVALLSEKTMTLDTMILRTGEAALSVPELVHGGISGHIDTDTTCGTVSNAL
jgi:hypothetical protein